MSIKIKKLLTFLLIFLTFFPILVVGQSPQQQVMVSQKITSGGGGGDPTFSALTVDGVGGTTTITVSHTVAAESNRGIVAAVAHRRDGLTDVSGINWVNEGTPEPLTIVTSSQVTQGDTVFELWQLIAPSIGTHDMTATITGGNSTIVMIVVSVANVNQTTPLGTVATATGTTSPITSTVGSIGATDLVIDFFVTEEPAANIVVGVDQTLRLLDNTAGTMDHGCSTQPGSSGGVMTWTSATDMGNWAHIAIAFKPV